MSTVGDALLDVLLRTAERGPHRLRRFAGWVADVARPPRGVTLATEDGSEYTGVVLVERNRPVLMLAAQVGSARSMTRAPIVPAHPYERPPRWALEEDDGLFR